MGQHQPARIASSSHSRTASAKTNLRNFYVFFCLAVTSKTSTYFDFPVPTFKTTSKPCAFGFSSPHQCRTETARTNLTAIDSLAGASDRPNGQTRSDRPNGQPRSDRPNGQPRSNRPNGQPRYVQPNGQPRWERPNGQPRFGQVGLRPPRHRDYDVAQRIRGNGLGARIVRWVFAPPRRAGDHRPLIYDFTEAEIERFRREHPNRPPPWQPPRGR